MKFDEIAAKIAADKKTKEANATSESLEEQLNSYCEMIESHMTFDVNSREVSAKIPKSDVSQNLWDEFKNNTVYLYLKLPHALNKRMHHDGLKVVTNTLTYAKVKTEPAYIRFSFRVEEL